MGEIEEKKNFEDSAKIEISEREKNDRNGEKLRNKKRQKRGKIKHKKTDRVKK